METTEEKTHTRIIVILTLWRSRGVKVTPRETQRSLITKPPSGWISKVIWGITFDIRLQIDLAAKGLNADVVSKAENW